jgi:hypothetical protein
MCGSWRYATSNPLYLLYGSETCTVPEVTVLRQGRLPAKQDMYSGDSFTATFEMSSSVFWVITLFATKRTPCFRGACSLRLAHVMFPKTWFLLLNCVLWTALDTPRGHLPEPARIRKDAVRETAASDRMGTRYFARSLIQFCVLSDILFILIWLVVMVSDDRKAWRLTLCSTLHCLLISPLDSQRVSVEFCAPKMRVRLAPCWTRVRVRSCNTVFKKNTRVNWVSGLSVAL